MEMKDEKNTESNSADADALTEDQNLSEEQYEITVGDIDSGDLDFDVADDEDEVGKDQKDKEQVSGEFTESDSDILDLDVLDFDLVDDGEDENADKLEKEDENENEVLDFENDEEEDDDELDNLPPLEESDLLNIDLEEPLDNTTDFAETAQQDELFDKFDDDDLSPFSFVGKQLVIFDTAKEQSDLLKKYLCERAGMDVECVGKKENLWRLLKIGPLDLIIIETGTEGKTDAMELMQQTKDQFPKVHFICLSGPVSLDKRLQFLNAGALDYLTRPLHLSTIAQSILVQFNRTEVYEIDAEVAGFFGAPNDISEEESLIDAKEPKLGEELDGSAKQSDDNLHLHVEIDLIDEDF